jgi:hypothetical protein
LVATSASITANSHAGGPYNVVATTNTGSATNNFSLTNLVGPPAHIATTGGSGQSTIVNTAFANPLVATVTDAGGNLLSGITVTFTPPPIAGPVLHSPGA